MSYTYDYPRPSVTVDAVVLRTPKLEYPEILLIKRRNPPFAEMWALPGGFLEMNENPLNGAARELQEETTLGALPLKPLFSCGKLGRDPRGRNITMLFGCLIRDVLSPPEGSDDASEAEWFSLKDLPELAFDHKSIINQIEQNLLWQAKTSLIGGDVFHGLASIDDITKLHQSLLGECRPDFIEYCEKIKILKFCDGICEYLPSSPIGSDWQAMVW